MNVTSQTSRCPNYRQDIAYAEIAENDFCNALTPGLENKGWKMIDVRKIKFFQNNDIDYVVDKTGSGELDEQFYQRVLDDKDRYINVEVKLDSRGISTGNFPYEVVSHGSSGWCVTTGCDFVYLALTDRDGCNILKRAWIDMKKWKDFCADRSITKKLSLIQNESIVDLLCNMDLMHEKGVLSWIE